ncbi:hypothetical protein SAMN04515674_10382 [Pseudarcicella hirudinis]|uniref:Pirin N-terminal domain-containing protein n=1 Tax=Pseudarcicella hirudinis TaxID=1079859 RepID=A0A1I5QA39_9BACT|nr:pirin family protein [Pseudarcicella hirudinis]SFP42901.1 hypothetical protein SAMN04515674_10382 [Pseudarcicella hirudinis]
MNKVIHRSDTRGIADHGWLKAAHTFSFAGYHNPERVHFGALRVLNDDSIAAGMGFSTHPHDNMEIITIPLKGDLEHKDTTGRQEVIRSGDVQIMSAGSGLYHSEKNHNKDQSLELLQIWVFPKERDIEPRYEQITFSQEAFKNKFQEIVSPRKDYEGVWINQDAYFYLGELESGISLNYDKKTKDGGAYIFLIEGSIEVDGELLNKRDAIGINDFNSLNITSTQNNSKVLIMEVPMAF